MELDLNGYTGLPPGKIACVVTYLEMSERPAVLPCAGANGLRLEEVDRADPVAYRELFRRVGEHWLWFSRLQMNDGELATLLRDPGIDFFALQKDGRPAGLLELDRCVPGEIEIAFFGVVEALIGTGAGRFLMGRALEIAWSRSPRRVWLHTCTLDHPRALGFYRKCGFRPYKLALEVADDPRLNGTLPRTAAPQVPLIEG